MTIIVPGWTGKSMNVSFGWAINNIHVEIPISEDGEIIDEHLEYINSRWGRPGDWTLFVFRVDNLALGPCASMLYEIRRSVERSLFAREIRCIIGKDEKIPFSNEPRYSDYLYVRFRRDAEDHIDNARRLAFDAIRQRYPHPMPMPARYRALFPEFAATTWFDDEPDES